MNGNAGSVQVFFSFGAGSAVTAPAGTWAAGGYISANGCASVLVGGGQFILTGVKLEIGSIATPYNRQSLAKSMADCQRYYQGGQLILGGYASAATHGSPLVKDLLSTGCDASRRNSYRRCSELH